MPLFLPLVSLWFFCAFFLFFLSTSPSFCSSPFHCSQLPLFIPFTIVGFTIFIPQLLLPHYACPSSTAHWPVNCPATTSTQSVLVAPLSIPRQNCLSCFLPLFVFTSLIRIRIKPPHYIPLWHASSGPSIYLPLLGEMSSQ